MNISETTVTSGGGATIDLGSSLRDADISAPPVREFVSALAERRMGLHSLQVVRHGILALDHWQWPHEPQRVHSLHSVAKSFTGTAVGFAISEGLLGLDDLVATFFAGRFPGPVSENMGRMRVRDLLTMQGGNVREISGATTRRRTDGWINDFLSEPVDEVPGTRFVYSSMSSHALSVIVQKVTGLPVAEYLRPRLFEPLGITDVRWQHDPDGVSSGGNGLSLTPTELLNFGRLYLQDGVWNGRQILPHGWVAQASTVHADNDTGGYGYQFWCFAGGDYSASGIFGQECMIFPEFDAVVLITGAMGDGSYHDLPEMLHGAFRQAFTGRASESEESEAAEWLQEWTVAAHSPRVLESTPQRVGTRLVYDFDDNEQEVRSLALDIRSDAVIVDLHDDLGLHTIEHGIGSWIEGRTGARVWPLHHSYQDSDAVILAAAEWDGPDSLTLTWNFAESPFTDTLTLTFDGDAIAVDHRSNINSGPTEMARAHGSRRS